ncbi:hypothetical protein BJ742DRAFT_777801 [Cladochytrium replicatum]|nr:hypothetical protein BJ742DRAFT_777801 [Cladochytrium replicatum]
MALPVPPPRWLSWIPKSIKDWKWLVIVNPDHPSSLPPASYVRSPNPGSQPAYVPWKNEAIHKNYYFNRDTRRNYPQTVVFTSSDISTHILPTASQPALPSPATEIAPEKTGATAVKAEGEWFPPIVDRSYKWKNVQEDIVADEMNPLYQIKAKA